MCSLFVVCMFVILIVVLVVPQMCTYCCYYYAYYISCARLYEKTLLHTFCQIATTHIYNFRNSFLRDDKDPLKPLLVHVTKNESTFNFF